MVVKNIQIDGVRITGKCIFKSKNCEWKVLLARTKPSLSLSLFLSHSSLLSRPGRGSRGKLK